MNGHDPQVYGEIIRRLRARDRLTFAEVMELALYHPDGGYYTTHVDLGPAGDFITAPEIHPAFGALLARQAVQCWEAMGSSASFAVVEQGAGRGVLAAAFLTHAHAHFPAFAAALGYILVDRSPRLIAQQRARLAPWGTQVSWAPDLPSGVEGVILSNELVDAFPVHRVVMRPDGLCEIYVRQDGGRLAWEEGPLSTPNLATYFDRLDLSPAVGQQAEVHLLAGGWMQQVAGALTRGMVLTIDFGDTARRHFHPDRRGGTLLAYRRQIVHDDLLADLGRQDLCARVDFTTLADIGREAGLTALGLVTQHHFLLNLGLEGWLAALDRLPFNRPEVVAARRALLSLVRTDGDSLGDAKVLVQCKDVPLDPDGLRTSRRRANARVLLGVPVPA